MEANDDNDYKTNAKYISTGIWSRQITEQAYIALVRLVTH